MAASGLKGDRSISIETEEHDARVRRDINRRDGCTTARCPRISPRTCREASRTSWRRADRRLRRWVVRAWAALTLTSVTWTSPPSAAAHVDQTTKHAIVEALRHESLPCPARGLEFVLYAEPVIRSATTEPGFELNLNSGARMSFRADYEPGEERHWFAIDRAILAAYGKPLFGPRAGALFAPIPRGPLLEVVAKAVEWHRDAQVVGSDAVLNACRALRFAAEDVWTSKIAAGTWALERHEESRLVARALAARQSQEPLSSREVRRFLEEVELRVREAAAR